MITRHITLLRTIICIVASISIQCFDATLMAVPMAELLQKTSVAHHNTPIEQDAPSFELSSPRLAIGSTSQTTQGITPIARTLHRTLRIHDKTSETSVAVRAIDSTTAGQRYSLYNHKILFYTHPRHYYLNGLMRLII